MVDSIGSSSGGGLSSLQQVRDRLYQALDRNSDGNVGKEEVSAFVLELSKSSISASKSADSDSSAAAGMKTGRAKGGMKSPDEMKSEIFDSADTNKDGQIDSDELAAMVAAGPGGKDSKSMFAEMDTDGDGLVSRAESDAAIDKMQQNRPQGGRPPGGMPPEELSSGLEDTAKSSGGTSLDELIAALNKNNDENEEFSSMSSGTQDSQSWKLLNALKSYLQNSSANSVAEFNSQSESDYSIIS